MWKICRIVWYQFSYLWVTLCSILKIPFVNVSVKAWNPARLLITSQWSKVPALPTPPFMSARPVGPLAWALRLRQMAWRVPYALRVECALESVLTSFKMLRCVLKFLLYQIVLESRHVHLLKYTAVVFFSSINRSIHQCLSYKNMFLLINCH